MRRGIEGTAVLVALLGCKSVTPGPTGGASTESKLPDTSAPAPEVPGPIAEPGGVPEPDAESPPVSVPIELRVRLDDPNAPEASGTADIFFVGDATEAEAATLTDAYFGECESLWGAVDPIERLSEHGYYMAQLICDNGEDYATRRLETMLVRVDVRARSAELVWWGPGESRSEMGACIDYRVFAFLLSPDAEHIEVRRQSEVIREAEADAFGLECEATPFESELVQTLPLVPVGG